MKILIIETTPATPHAETALEIGVKASLAGSEVIYSPIFHLLPRLTWKSNINGDNNKGTLDSTKDWINYLVEKISPFAHVDIPDSFDITKLTSLEDIKKNPLNFNHEGEPLGDLVLSAMREYFKENNLEVIDKFYNENCISAITSSITYEISKNLINKHNPDKVVFFNGRTLETLPLYLAAKKSNIDLIIHERGPTKNHFTLWKAPAQYIDYYSEEIRNFSKNRNHEAKNLSAAIFYHRQKNASMSTMNYIFVQQTHDAEVNLATLNEKYIVFYTTSNWELQLMPNQELSNDLGNQYEVVEKLSHICKQENIQLVLRLHPNSPISEVNIFNTIAQKNHCLVILPNDLVSSYSLGKNAFRIFTYGSTISWEFMYAKIHCAILSKSIGSNSAGVVELNNIPSVIEYIKNDLVPIDNSFAIMFGDFTINYGERYDFYKPTTLFSGAFNLDLDKAI